MPGRGIVPPQAACSEGLRQGRSNMFWSGAREARARIAALDKSQAIIEFKLDGIIITANKNFLDAMGYQLSEIQGHHHSMFVEPAYKESAEYREFWAKLARG